MPFQRRHALAGRHVPDLERLVAPPRPRHDAPPVRKHGNALDLRRTHIITKVQWTPQRTSFECPSSVATHLPVATSHTLSVLSFDPETTRRPSGNTATHSIYIKDTSPKKKGGHCAPHFSRVPFQRRHAFTGRYIPQLETLVERRRNDVPPVWKDRNAADLRRSHITKVQIVDAAQRTFSECPFSVFTHFPVATSQTLSVLSVDAETMRRPSENTATQFTYNESRSQNKSTRKSGRAAPHAFRVPFQRCHAFAGRHVPHLERVVARRRNDAPPVRKHGNALDLQRKQIITKVPQKVDAACRTETECPFRVFTHLPVATSHTLTTPGFP